MVLSTDCIGTPLYNDASTMSGKDRGGALPMVCRQAALYEQDYVCVFAAVEDLIKEFAGGLEARELNRGMHLRNLTDSWN